MSDQLKEFLVSFGFSVDGQSQARAEAGIRAAEDRITAKNVSEAAKRIEADKRTNVARIAAAAAAGAQLTEVEKNLLVAQDRLQKSAEAEREKRARDADKRDQERRDASVKKLREAALSFTSFTLKLFAGIETLTGAGALYATDKAAKALERINFAAQASGSTPKSINAIVYSLTQLGDTAESAQSSLEAFGSNIVKFKAFEDIVSNMGIQTREANGQLRDTGELFLEYTKKLSSLPRATREAMAEGWGIHATSVQAAVRPEFAGYVRQKEQDQAAVGYDPNVAAKDATAFEQSMGRVNSLLDTLRDKIGDELFKVIGPQLDQVSEWLRANGKTISDVIASVASGLEKLGASIIQAIASDGDIKTAMTVVAEAMKQFGNYIGSDDFKKSIKTLVADVISLAKAMRWALGKLGILSSPDDSSKTPDPSLDIHQGSESSMYYASTRGRHVSDISDAEAAEARDKKSQFGRGGPSVLRTAQQKENAAVIADEMRKAGLPDEGMAAGLGSMQTESTFNPRAHNDVAGGHTGLWQWDATRWPKVRAWIEGQGGDPWDARWQTRAWIAEGQAKPGDALYDTAETSGGFRDLMNSKGDLSKAVHGVQRSERFGLGEEGGRARNAGEWLRQLPGATASDTAPSPAGTSDRAITDGEVYAARQRLAAGGRDPKDKALVDSYLAQQQAPKSIASTAMSHAKRVMRWMGLGSKVSNSQQQDAEEPITTVDRRNPKFAPSVTDTLRADRQKLAEAMNRHARNLAIVEAAKHHRLLGGYHKPLGDTPGLHASINNSRTKGDTHVTHNPSFVINGGDQRQNMETARMVSDRGNQDLLRNIAGMEA